MCGRRGDALPALLALSGSFLPVHAELLASWVYYPQPLDIPHTGHPILDPLALKLLGGLGELAVPHVGAIIQALEHTELYAGHVEGSHPAGRAPTQAVRGISPYRALVQLKAHLTAEHAKVPHS